MWLTGSASQSPYCFPGINWCTSNWFRPAPGAIGQTGLRRRPGQVGCDAKEHNISRTKPCPGTEPTLGGLSESLGCTGMGAPVRHYGQREQAHRKRAALVRRARKLPRPAWEQPVGS